MAASLPVVRLLATPVSSGPKEGGGVGFLSALWSSPLLLSVAAKEANTA